MSFDPERARAIIAARAQQPAVPVATAAARTSTQPEPEIEKDIPMADQAETDLAAIQAKATADAIAAATTRMTAVINSDHYAGREKLASTLLAQPSMSAESIIAALADAPAPAAVAAALVQTQEDTDSAKMLAGITAAQPAGLGASPGADTPALSEEDRLLKATVDALANFK